MPKPLTGKERIKNSLYGYLWGKFQSFSKPLTMEQQTDLDGLLSDIARELAAKRAGLFEQRLRIGEGLYKAQSMGLLGIDGIARQQ